MAKRLRRLTLARRPRPPATDAVASAYAAKTVKALRPVLDLVRRHVLPLANQDFQPDRVDAAADFRTIAAAFAGLRLGVFQKLTADTALGALGASRAADAKNRDEFRRVLRVDPFASEPWLAPLTDDWVTENVSLVRTVAERQLSALEATMLRMVRGGDSVKDIREEMQRRFDLGVGQAKLLARDQVNKYNGRLNLERQTRLGVTEYIWRTSEDARVRPDHARLDGGTFKWAEPPVTVRGGSRAGERNHPGGDIQCRCWPEPILEGIAA